MKGGHEERGLYIFVNLSDYRSFSQTVNVVRRWPSDKKLFAFSKAGAFVDRCHSTLDIERCDIPRKYADLVGPFIGKIVSAGILRRVPESREDLNDGPLLKKSGYGECPVICSGGAYAFEVPHDPEVAFVLT